MSSLTGKVAVVTASSRGIGRSIALRLGRDGAAVAVNYVASPEKAEAVVQEIIASGGRSIISSVRHHWDAWDSRRISPMWWHF